MRNKVIPQTEAIGKAEDCLTHEAERRAVKRMLGGGERLPPFCDGVASDVFEDMQEHRNIFCEPSASHFARPDE